MPPAADLTPSLQDARAFAESVASVLDRHAPSAVGWAPGDLAQPLDREVSAALDAIGWVSLAEDAELVACAGLAGVELGRRLASIHHIDRLLGGSPVAAGLARSVGPERLAVQRVEGVLRLRPIGRDEPVPSAEGLDVRRVHELGDPVGPAAAQEGGAVEAAAADAWLAAGLGYLAGVGQGALELTVDYVSQRRAFGATLAALAPVQQLLADAATAVRGVVLLAGAAPGADALAHAGPAVTGACAACQQVTGALGYTLEYPLHRFTQRARAVATFNDALLDALF